MSQRLNIIFNHLTLENKSDKEEIEMNNTKNIKIDKMEFLKKNPKNEQFIPITNIKEINKLPKEIKESLKWMAQKDSLHQDIFLIGHPGNLKRNLAFLYCEISRREIEYVIITKDTTEHDLKQRREILNKNAYYVDQAAVKVFYSS
jgi:von Willebrand factor A domain-containing protein 8